MKWFLIIVLISAIMLIAYSVSEQYRDKFDFYTNLKLFLQQFKLNVSFRQQKINEFLNTIKPKKQFKLFVEDYKTYLKTNQLNLTNIKILEPDEREELSRLVTSLGNHDAKNEVHQLDGFLATLELNLTKATDDKNKLCPMILKLSLLFAIGLAILLI